MTTTSAAGLPSAEVVVTGQILYGQAQGAQRAATADILAVYASNPAYMHMRALGLSETDNGRGTRMFQEARASTNKALAKAAAEGRIDVITVPGGVSGGEQPIPDLTVSVIDKLPVYFVDGKVLSGNAQTCRRAAELDSSTLLLAIPAWRESLALTENDANYHFLRKQAFEAYEKALKAAADDGGFDAVIERGGVSCRLGPVPDLTQQAVAALSR